MCGDGGAGAARSTHGTRLFHHNCNPQADIRLAPGSHASEAAVNKQLADKERVAAALENPNLLQMVDRCLGACREL